MRARALLVSLAALGASLPLPAEGVRAATDEDSARECPTGQRAYENDCITDPVPIEKRSPKYPRRARRYRVEARVRLEAVITREGKVIDPEVKECTSPGWGFESAALKAVKRWRYRPAKVNGEVKSIYFTIVVDFKMRGSGE